MGEEYYYRHLPHYQPAGATFFVTFRLAGSFPVDVIERMRRQRASGTLKKQYLTKYEDLLDGIVTGPTWLGMPLVARVVEEAIRYRDGRQYELLGYCIMPNHVHMVIDSNVNVGRNVIPPDKPLFRVLQSLKRYTARKANAILCRSGPFWQDESYDHVVRNDGELQRILWYVAENPVKAGFVTSWEHWPWTYIKNGW